MADVVYRNIKYDDFIKTFKATDDQYKEAYRLWGQEKWSELEQYFIKNKLNYDSRRNIYWPPFRGFINMETLSLKLGTEIDRYGGYYKEGKFIDGGSFVSPKDASFESRALPEITKNEPLKKYRVIKEIPEVKSGTSAPWFGQKGGGIQYELPYSIDELLKGKYIEIIE